ncbi:hypothetical protein SAMN05444267_101158 [Chryseobacterium polytrichastri]|uniref:Uncharacterized protein n=1 Tax=Chryseobacterium polytrichastri TaxID=1302687 RepID=A0A1M6XMF5_9FLAO|nr:hypothetical protein SAMN05444267_101158 [Chryseobacterium polytrichastri]
MIKIHNKIFNNKSLTIAYKQNCLKNNPYSNSNGHTDYSMAINFFKIITYMLLFESLKAAKRNIKTT